MRPALSLTEAPHGISRTAEPGNARFARLHHVHPSEWF